MVFLIVVVSGSLNEVKRGLYLLKYTNYLNVYYVELIAIALVRSVYY